MQSHLAALNLPDSSTPEGCACNSLQQLPTAACCVQDGYVEERSALGPVNLTVPGGSPAGSLTLPLRLLDGFTLYVEDAGGAEVVVGLEMLANGADLAWWRQLIRSRTCRS